MVTDTAKPPNPLRRDVDREVVQVWLDALSTAGCDEQEFLRAVAKLTRRSTDAGWDALALLDQYYRLGKIPTEIFNGLNSSLANQLVGISGSDSEDVSVPLPQPEETEILPAPPTLPTLTTASVIPAPATRAPAAPASQAGPRPVPAAEQPEDVPTISVASASFAPTPARPPDAPAVAPTAAPAAASAPAAAPAPAAAQAARPAQAAREAAGGAPAPAKHTAAVEPLRRSTRREIAVGEVLRGRYVIKSVLGRGGTGTVFEAADLYRVGTPEAGQRVALKVLHGQIAAKPQLLAELQREFQLLQSLSHPNVVRAYDLDRDGDIAFFTMEVLRGLSLRAVLAARNRVRLERAHALAIVRDVGGAVAHAHSRAVIHGDLNPGNIFLTNDGEIRLLDCGAAHVSFQGPTVSDSTDRSPIATPRYASPQVLRGHQPDARDDVYSLACLAYLLLSGARPFGEKTALGAQEQGLEPSRPSGLRGKEWRALRAGLAFDRERRPADVAQWLEAFDWRRAVPHLPPLVALVRVAAPQRRRSAAPALVAAAVVAAVAAALWANAYFRGDKGAPSAAANDSTRPSDTPNGQLDPGSPAAPSSSPSAQSTAEQPTERAPSPPGSLAPQAAAPSSSSPPAPRASSPANNRTRLAASQTGAAASSQRAAPPPPSASAPPSSTEGATAGALARSRVELAADTIDVPLTDPAARIVVRRHGSLQGAATFTWWTESGTAKPGQDFVAVAPRSEVIEDGKSSVSLLIPVVGDTARAQPKSFYVVINDPGPGVTLGSRTLTMVTIPPSQ
jgi:serine/threonine protein kinase